MASKLELKEAANKLKEAGVKERYCIDWEDLNIKYLAGENVNKYAKKAVKK